MDMDTRTSINIEKKTLKKLRGLRITKRETYDEIINRLMKSYKKKNGKK